MLHRAKKTSIRLAKKHRNLLLYGVIGVSGVIIDFIIYTILVKLKIPAFAASMVSVSAGIVNNFIWNTYYNFKKTDHIWRRFASFYIVGTTGVILSIITIIVLHNIIGIDPIIAKLVSVPFIVAFQYFFNKESSMADDYKKIPWKQLIIFITCLSVILIFIFNSIYCNFADEADNLLGGQLIAQGKIIYVDYFSHHMPLTYFFAAPLFLLLGNKIIAIKVVFSIFMSSWLLIMSRHLIKKYNLQVFIAFTLLISITQTLSWSHMLLAETIIAFSTTHAFILLITSSNRKINYIKELTTIALLGSAPVLSSASYFPISLLIYMIGIMILFSNKKIPKLKYTIYFCLMSSLPYLTLMLYLYFNHAIHKFIFQSITFNTLYYSQFTTSAPTSLPDSIFTIIQGTFGSLRDALFLNTNQANQIIPFMFALSTLLSIFYLFKKKNYATGILFTLIMFFASSRLGFSAILSDGGATRSGTTILFIGLLIFCYILFSSNKDRNNKNDIMKLIPYVIIVTLLLIGLASITKMACIGRDYVKKQNTVLPSEVPNSNAYIINLINRPNDKYWIGPFDFTSQLVIKSNNASSYRFYLPWHAACKTCQEELILDIVNNRPEVINFYKDADIWGIKAYNYAAPLISTFNNYYYEIKDQRLSGFYFLKSDSVRINDILIKQGYRI